MTLIRSRQHPFVVQCRQLARSGPAESGAVLLDGVHLAREAVASGLRGLTMAVGTAARDRAEVTEVVALVRQAGGTVLDVTNDVLEAASPVKSPSGIVAVAPCRRATLDEALGSAPALVAAALDVQDAGNLGAIIRAAEAAGATGVVVAGQSADPLGWRAIRGSMGSVFRIPVAVVADAAALLAGARGHGITTLATGPAGGQDLYATNLARPILVVLGAEGAGLDEQTYDACDERVRIPMAPPVESMNVAVAAGVILFEARRQRASGPTR